MLHYSHRASSRTVRSTNAFTLIELLVVIAIIAILAAILFPVFARARENARRSSCQSNEKQIGLGIFQYAQDYDEHYPMRYSDAMGISWDAMIQPYLGVGKIQNGISVTNQNSSILHCPSDSILRYGYAGYAPRSYSMPKCPQNGHKNLFFSTEEQNDANGKSYEPGRALSALEDSAGTIMIAERVTDSNIFGSPNGSDVGSPACGAINGCNWSPQLAPNNGGVSEAYHLGTMNYLFADGHVKSIQPVRTIGTTACELGTPAIDQPCGMWSIHSADHQ